MLLTRSRSIAIDARNNLGFTPLMKAALQGRTRCAKLLLFAGEYLRRGVQLCTPEGSAIVFLTLRIIIAG